jgi:hypothetical protein
MQFLLSYKALVLFVLRFPGEEDTVIALAVTKYKDISTKNVRTRGGQ